MKFPAVADWSDIFDKVRQHVGISPESLCPLSREMYYNIEELETTC